MYVLIADLHKHRTRIREQIASHRKPVAQIGEVAMDAIAPGVAEGFHLFRFTGNLIDLAIRHGAAGSAPLKIAVEFDAIGWIKIDALHLTTQSLALCQTRHHLE